MYRVEMLDKNDALRSADIMTNLVNECLIEEGEDWWAPWRRPVAERSISDTYDRYNGVLMLVRRGSEYVGYASLRFRGAEAFLGWCAPRVRDKNVITHILRAVRRILSYKRVASFEAGCGVAFGPRCCWLRDSASWLDYDFGGTVMVYHGGKPSIMIPEGYAFEYVGSEDAKSIIRKIYPESLGDEYEEGDEDVYLSHLSLLEPEIKVQVIIAVDEHSTPVGFITYYDFESLRGERIGYLDLLMVHPDHRRRGIGRALLLDATRRLMERTRHVYLVAATMWSEWLPAFYHKLGFRITRQYMSYQTLPSMLP